MEWVWVSLSDYLGITPVLNLDINTFRYINLLMKREWNKKLHKMYTDIKRILKITIVYISIIY